MTMRRYARAICWTLTLLFSFCPDSGETAEKAKKFRISAVQENQVWIEGGLIDGLDPGMEGDIGYEITVMGQQKRIVPAKVRLSKVEDTESIGFLYEASGIVNIGYTAQFIPKLSNERLLFFNTRASAFYEAGDFKLARQYYQRILEILPGDAFAARRVKDCETQLEAQDALMRERRNIPYYREVIRASMEQSDADSRRLAGDYIDKILSVEPEDAEALNFRAKLAQLNSHQTTSEPPDAVSPPSAPATRETAAAFGKSIEPAIPETAGPKPTPSATPTAIPENMVRIPGGDYLIGSLPGRSPFENELPRHQVHLQPFFLDRYEVTNEEYKRFCDATGHAYPEYFINGDFPPGAARRPVVMVSWSDADAYAHWAGKRLPTEFEWEIAAAGSSGKTWPWGNRWISNAANTREKGDKDSGDVGAYPFDVSDYGIYDLAGNVSEWTQNWYQPYRGNRRKEKEYGEQYKVLRGGSSKASKEFARSQFRARLPVSYRSMDLGFRCALSADEGLPGN
jgi:formylglycine-generating enzyme required for sulfatase activity